VIGVLVVTHGRLAAELVAAAETIAGSQPGFRALALDWREGLDAARAKIGAELAALRAAAPGESVLILTDMFGDTPSNAAAGFVEAGRVELIAGVNLPMVVGLACAGGRRGTLEQIARRLELRGKRGIRRAAGAEPAPGSGPCDG
jgi:PTS system mannose-specific IIA component